MRVPYTCCGACGWPLLFSEGPRLSLGAPQLCPRRLTQPSTLALGRCCLIWEYLLEAEARPGEQPRLAVGQGHRQGHVGSFALSVGTELEARVPKPHSCPRLATALGSAGSVWAAVHASVFLHFPNSLGPRPQQRLDCLATPPWAALTSPGGPPRPRHGAGLVSVLQ